jgi:hypothetical protein
VKVPSGTSQVNCTTEADNGNLELEIKIGQNLLSVGFDCLSYSDTSYEECILDMPAFFGSSEYIFAMVWSWNTTTTSGRIKCTAVEDPEPAVSVGRGNPDLMPYVVYVYSGIFVVPCVNDLIRCLGFAYTLVQKLQEC